ACGDAAAHDERLRAERLERLPRLCDERIDGRFLEFAGNRLLEHVVQLSQLTYLVENRRLQSCIRKIKIIRTDHWSREPDSGFRVWSLDLGICLELGAWIL